MGVISSFQRSFGVLKAAPALFAVALLYMVINSVGSVLQSLGNSTLQLLGMLWSLGAFAFVVPLFVGGLLALADRGLRGDGSIGDFVDGGVGNYLYLLGYTWVVGVVEFVWAIVVTFVGYILLLIVGVTLFLGVVGFGGGDVAMIVGGILGLLILLVAVVLFYLVVGIPVFVVQFVPGAWVIDDMELVDGIKRALRLLVDNFLRVVAFDLAVLGIWILFALVSFLPFVVAGLVLGPEAVIAESYLELFSGTGGPPGAGPGGGPGAGPGGTSGQSVFTPLGIGISTVTGLVTGTLQFSLVVAFYTAFYHDISPDGR